MQIGLICCVNLAFLLQLCNAQKFEFTGKRKKQSIPFKSIKNLIVVPVSVNGKGPYDFILDTGVGPMIILDPSILDSLDFSKLRKISIAGLGTDTVQAFVSQNLDAQIGRAKIHAIPTAILKEDVFNLSGYLGKKIYGIIGYSFFNSFVVDVRYRQNRLMIYANKNRIKPRGKPFPLQIYNQRPYLNAQVILGDTVKANAKFLVDTGASHALSLETLNDKDFPLPNKNIPAYLGMSLSGVIKGAVGRVDALNFAGFTFRNLVAGFPLYKDIVEKIADSKRNGTIGADLLRRFDLQFNYADSIVYLKKNSNAKKPFNYDRVGLTIFLDHQNFKRYIIAQVEPASPAEKAGVLAEDEILSVNFTDVKKYSLDELAELFKSNRQTSIVLEIARKGKTVFRIVRPENRI